MRGHKKRSKIDASDMEKTFIANSTLKRNKRYLDVEKINNIENQYQQKRRKPFTASLSVDQKISNSFLNSTAALTDRLDQDIGKFRQRISICGLQSELDKSNSAGVNCRPQSQRSSRSPAHVKGVSIGKGVSRDQYYSIRGKPAHDERLFANFSLNKTDQAHTPSLAKGPQRSFDSSLKHINDIYYETQKLYQEYYYKKTSTKCRVNYKAEVITDRSFFNSKRPENDPSTDISPKAVRKSYDYAHKRPLTSQGFYSNSGRQLPCQLDNRGNTTLTNFWIDGNGLIQRQAPEYSLRKLKDDLVRERLQKIKKSKSVKFNKNEVCDKKFFSIGKNQ